MDVINKEEQIDDSLRKYFKKKGESFKKVFTF